MISPTGAPQATPRRVAVALTRAYVLLAAAVAFLIYSAWHHYVAATALACLAVVIGAIGLYYAAVARGATR